MAYSILPMFKVLRKVWMFTPAWSRGQRGLRSSVLLGFCIAVTISRSVGQTSSALTQQKEYLDRIVESATALRMGIEPARIAGWRPIDTGKCGTPLQMEISRLWQQFSPQQKAQLLRVTSRPTLHTSKLSPSGFFRIHYDTTGLDAPALLDQSGQRIEGTYHAFVDSAASAFERSREVEVGILQYPDPPTDGAAGGGPEYDIYVRDLSASRLYGQPVWTGEEPIDTTRLNFTTRSYLEIENDFRGSQTSGLPGLKVTAAHELHHAIQIGNYGIWFDDFYFYELTSTWVEEIVYDEVNDYYFWLPLYFRNVHIPFNRTDALSFTGPERAIWGIYLTERHGPSIMRRTWEEMVNVRSVEALELTLNEFGDSFAQSFADFFLWNFFTGYRASGDSYYDEAADYPTVRILSRIDLSSGTGRIVSTARPLSSQYHQVVLSPDTITLILVNRDIQSAKNHEYIDFDYEFEISTSSQPDTFFKLPNGVNVRFTAADPNLWQTVFLINNAVATGSGTQPDTYPSPFVLNSLDVLVIPLEQVSDDEVTLYVFASDLELVYSKSLQPRRLVDQYVATWDGKNNDGEEVSSGIYFYVIESRKGTRKGKFVVLQK